jgi:hypothetical protein
MSEKKAWVQGKISQWYPAEMLFKFKHNYRNAAKAKFGRLGKIWLVHCSVVTALFKLM